MSSENQNLMFIKNNIQNYFDSTETIKRQKKIIETKILILIIILIQLFLKIMN